MLQIKLAGLIVLVGLATGACSSLGAGSSGSTATIEQPPAVVQCQPPPPMPTRKR